MAPLIFKEYKPKPSVQQETRHSVPPVGKQKKCRAVPEIHNQRLAPAVNEEENGVGGNSICPAPSCGDQTSAPAQADLGCLDPCVLSNGVQPIDTAVLTEVKDEAPLLNSAGLNANPTVTDNLLSTCRGDEKSQGTGVMGPTPSDQPIHNSALDLVAGAQLPKLAASQSSLDHAHFGTVGNTPGQLANSPETLHLSPALTNSVADLSGAENVPENCSAAGDFELWLEGSTRSSAAPSVGSKRGATPDHCAFGSGIGQQPNRAKTNWTTDGDEPCTTSTAPAMVNDTNGIHHLRQPSTKGVRESSSLEHQRQNHRLSGAEPRTRMSERVGAGCPNCGPNADEICATTDLSNKSALAGVDKGGGRSGWYGSCFDSNHAFHQSDEALHALLRTNEILRGSTEAVSQSYEVLYQSYRALLQSHQVLNRAPQTFSQSISPSCEASNGRALRSRRHRRPRASENKRRYNLRARSTVNIHNAGMESGDEQSGIGRGSIAPSDADTNSEAGSRAVVLDEVAAYGEGGLTRRRWGELDDKMLMAYKIENKSDAWIAKKLNRTVSAITQRRRNKQTVVST